MDEKKNGSKIPWRDVLYAAALIVMATLAFAGKADLERVSACEQKIIGLERDTATNRQMILDLQKALEKFGDRQQNMLEKLSNIEAQLKVQSKGGST